MIYKEPLHVDLWEGGGGFEGLHPRILYFDTEWLCVVHFTSAQFKLPDIQPTLPFVQQTGLNKVMKSPIM